MKRLLAFAAVAVAAAGAVPAHAAPRCQGPVSTDCTTKNDDGDDVFCNVYVRVDTPTGGTTAACVELDG